MNLELLQRLDTSIDTVDSSKHKDVYQVDIQSLTSVESPESVQRKFLFRFDLVKFDLMNLQLALEFLRVA